MRFPFRVLAIVGFVLAPVVLPTPSSASVQFSFEIFSLPGDGQINGWGINGGGDVVGCLDHFGSGALKRVGFVRRGGGVEVIDVPGADAFNGTQARGIDDGGRIVGRFTEAGRTHGFTLDGDGIQPFDVPGSWFTEAFDVNENGVIVGRTFLDAGPVIGTAFLRTGAEYTLFRPEGARGPYGIGFLGLNDRGDTVGQVLDETGFRAFARVAGTYMPFSIPGAGNTLAWDINDANQIVGSYTDGSGTHGFLMDASGTYRIDVPAPGSDGTWLTGINDAGFLVGAIGFRRFPVREVLVGTPCDEISDTCLPATRIGDPLVVLTETVEIDVKPGDAENPIHPGGRGVIPVALLGSDAFDVANVDVRELAFGPAGAAPAHARGGHREDVNGDGWIDLVSHYRTSEVGLEPGAEDACVTGRRLDGAPFEGCDTVRVVPACGLGFEPAVLLPLLGARRRRQASRPA